MCVSVPSSKYELLPAGLVMEGTTLAAYVAKTSKAMFLQDVLYVSPSFLSLNSYHHLKGPVSINS